VDCDTHRFRLLCGFHPPPPLSLPCHTARITPAPCRWFATSSMERSPSWESDSHWNSQAIIRLLWNPKVRYHVHKRQPLQLILSKINPVHSFTSYVFEAQFNLRLVSEQSLSWGICMYFPPPPRMLYPLVSLLPNIVVEWLTLPLRIREVPRSIIGPGDRLIWLRFSWFSSVRPGECRVMFLQLGHDCFLPYSFQFITIYLSYHRRYII
jgi:hypothetical protein